MLSKLEKKILQCKKVRIQGVMCEFKRCTPEDFLGKEGIPISKWQSEADFIATKERTNNTTWEETKQTFKKLFSKALISVDGKDTELDKYIDIILGNYFIATELYSEIVSHCLGFKKKTILLQRLAKQHA